MRKRPLGEAIGEVSEIALGTWGLSGDGYGAVSDRVRDEVIARALAVGISVFETSDVYAKGGMEQSLGKQLRQAPKALVVTKIGTCLDATPPRRRFDGEYLRQCCESSAERLQAPPGVVLLHNPAEKTVLEAEACGVLAELKQAGTIRAWGVSAGSAAVARAAIAQGADVLELAYNVFFSSAVEGLDLDRNKVGLMARSVLAYGLLCGQWAGDKIFRDGDHRRDRWTEEQLAARISQLSVVSGALGGQITTLRAAALRYVLASSKVSCAVLGPRNRVQLDQLVREAGSGPQYMPEHTVDQIRSGMRRLGAQA